MRIAIVCLLLLSACGVVPKYDTGTFVWAGCHRVDQNPSPEGSTAYILASKLNIGDLMYLQQINTSGNATVTVGEPCK
jgi:hypothetical protein